MDCTSIFKSVKRACRELTGLKPDMVRDILLALAAEAESEMPFIISENEKDLARMAESDPGYDRLKLTGQRLKSIVSDIRKVAMMPSPAGRILSEYTRPDGLKINRVAVPFGIVGVIYESRPNVTFDVFSLCFKSGNAVILKGGSNAVNSNMAITGIIKSVLIKRGLDENIIALLPPGREETKQLLKARGFVDIVIPRGSSSLINYVRENASVPVIETGAGICHSYFDESGDMAKGKQIIKNAKTRRVSVCNALDCLIIHKKRIEDLPDLVEPCSGYNVVIYADEEAYRALKGKYPGNLLEKATSESFGTEFLSYKMAVKTVTDFSEAVEHIAQFGSGHSEAIITEDPLRQEEFLRLVDASSVYVNASTAFTDGGEFGLGAEIGISTQKLHARGPMALEALTTYKWIIRGNGHTRP